MKKEAEDELFAAKIQRAVDLAADLVDFASMLDKDPHVILGAFAIGLSYMIAAAKGAPSMIYPVIELYFKKASQQMTLFASGEFPKSTTPTDKN